MATKNQGHAHAIELTSTRHQVFGAVDGLAVREPEWLSRRDNELLRFRHSHHAEFGWPLAARITRGPGETQWAGTCRRSGEFVDQGQVAEHKWAKLSPFGVTAPAA